MPYLYHASIVLKLTRDDMYGSQVRESSGCWGGGDDAIDNIGYLNGLSTCMGLVCNIPGCTCIGYLQSNTFFGIKN